MKHFEIDVEVVDFRDLEAIGKEILVHDRLDSWLISSWSIEKIDRGATYVMVANHQSLLVILVLFRLFFHFKWVSKIENFRVPCIGWNMTLNRYIPLRRGDKGSIVQMLRDCREALAAGNSIMMFPEGTRSPDGRLRSFKTGAFELAKQAYKPILASAGFAAITAWLAAYYSNQRLRRSINRLRRAADAIGHGSSNFELFAKHARDYHVSILVILAEVDGKEFGFPNLSLRGLQQSPVVVGVVVGGGFIPLLKVRCGNSIHDVVN